MITTKRPFSQNYRKTLLFIIGLFLLILKGYGQKVYPETYDSDSIIKTGIQFNDNGQYDKALAEYDKIFKTDPQYYLAKYEKVLTLSAMELPDQVHAELEEWYKSEFAFEVPEAMILYGNSLVNKKKFDEAEKVFNLCLKVIPESPILMYNIALMHYNMEDKTKCVEYLKKTILLNPNHGIAHYFLGLVCMEEGKIAHGALALLGYLILVPTGGYSEDAMLQLNVKMSQNFLNNDSKLILPKGVDDFTELESILRDQLPLHPKYKLKVSIDEIFTRHLQAILEYAAFHEIKGGFFEKTYLPWMKDIVKKNLTESVTYYMIQQSRDKLGKSLTSKQNEIDLFTENWVLKDFWNLFAKRKQNHYGSEQDVIIYIEGEFPHLIGSVINGKYQGKFRMVDKHNRTTADLNFADDLMDGKQIYYQQNRKIMEELQYTKGVKNGLRTAYYENGQKSVIETIKNDVYDGPFTTFYPNGMKNCEGAYTKDKLNGNYHCFHMDGSKRLESSFVNDKLNGSYKMYNPGGDLVSSFQYINGELTGDGWEYYDGKILITSGNYINGKAEGPVKEYWANQTLKNQTIYENGKIKSYENYYINGKISELRTYNAKEQLENIVYFDILGEKYYEEKYSGENFKSGFQYLKNNPKPVEIKKNDFIVKYPDGTPSHKGKFNGDLMNGKWTYYYSNGHPSFEMDYVKNQMEGMRKSFDKAGQLTNIAIMKQNKANGLNKIFENGTISQVSYYKDDVQTGPFKVYRRDSTLKFEGYLINNENQYSFYNYYNNNQLMSESRYIDNYVYQTKYYNKNGQLTQVDSFLNLNGNVTTKTENGLVISEENYKNGVKSGKYISKDIDDDMIHDLNFTNDQLHGRCLYFHQTGALGSESNFYHGKPNGQAKYYDLNGTLRTTVNFIFGAEYGTSYRYYHNGKPLYKYDVLADMKHGEYVFYNIEGKEVAALGYNQDFMEYYKVIDKSSGKLGNTVAVSRDASVTIESYYSDGKEAFRLQADKGIWNKTLKISDQNGNINFACDYTDGKINGSRKEYYANGKIYKAENFLFDAYHGDQEFYDTSGNPLYTVQYKYDEIHGELKIYKNGKLIKTKVYDTEQLISIQKH